jgi:hypothetical protein
MGKEKEQTVQKAPIETKKRCCLVNVNMTIHAVLRVLCSPVCVGPFQALPNVVITISTCGNASFRLALWRFPHQAPLHTLAIPRPKECLSVVYSGRQFPGRFVSICGNAQLIFQACVSSIDEQSTQDNAMHNISQHSVIVDSQG